MTAAMPWELAQRDAVERARVAFSEPHRVHLVGFHAEPWRNAKRARINTRTRTMRLSAGKPYADEAGELVGRVAVFSVEFQKRR